MHGSLIIPRATSEAAKVSLVVDGGHHDIHLFPKSPTEVATPIMQAFVRALAREAARSAFRVAEGPPLPPEMAKK